jgi:hypothetical protein
MLRHKALMIIYQEHNQLSLIVTNIIESNKNEIGQQIIEAM